MTEVKPLGLRASLLREIMKDAEYREKYLKAKEWHEIIDVIREFAEKKGYKFMEIYA
jgi:hypothetical protein